MGLYFVMGLILGLYIYLLHPLTRIMLLCSSLLMGRSNSNTQKKTPISSSNSKNFTSIPPQQQICYEGEALARLLSSINRGKESARLVDSSLPYQIWLKQQFCIGVNDVTRVLERMPPFPLNESSPQPPHLDTAHLHRRKAPLVQLQAILVASDCVPRWLTRHLPSLASTKKVPLIFVKDNKGGSLRLGEVVNLRTTIAIGVKGKGNAMNQLIEEILRDDEIKLGKVP